jgi:two-component system, cell cycle sensor histidine kinase and response regulator CckA
MTEHSMPQPTFSIDLNCRVHDGIAHRAEVVAPHSPCDVRIMLVDDEPMVRSVLSRALRREGYQIVDAGDGLEALNLIEDGTASPVHLLITDLNMPRLGGVDLARHMRATNHVQRVIFMTGDTPAGSLIDGDHSALLQKPFNLKTLASAVHQILAD